MKTLQHEGGMWSETDISSIRRQGEDGRLVAEAMLDARGRLLHEFRFAGRSGRHVKWFSRTVKWSGNLNETILAAQTMGPLAPDEPPRHRSYGDRLHPYGWTVGT